MTIWRHWCKGCGARIGPYDAGYCGAEECRGLRQAVINRAALSEGTRAELLQQIDEKLEECRSKATPPPSDYVLQLGILRLQAARLTHDSVPAFHWEGLRAAERQAKTIVVHQQRPDSTKLMSGWDEVDEWLVAMPAAQRTQGVVNKPSARMSEWSPAAKPGVRNRGVVAEGHREFSSQHTIPVKRAFEDSFGTHLDKVANINGLLRQPGESDQGLRHRLEFLLVHKV